MIQHCGGNKHVRKRVPDEPGLMRHNHPAREIIHLAYLMPVDSLAISKTSRPMPSINASLMYDYYCDESCSVRRKAEETYNDTHGERP